VSEEAAAAPAPGPTRPLMPGWLRQAIVESVLIVVSLLLALGLNEWNEARVRAERVAELRQFFVEEIRSNRTRLASDEIYPHHLRLRKALAGYEGADRPTEADRERAFAPFRTGVHPMGFRDAVWRSAGFGDLLQHMDQREVFMLADIYRLQENLDEINRAAYSQLISANPGSEDPAEVAKLVRTLQLYLGDVTAIEAELLVLYGRALKQLSDEPKRARARS